MAFKLPNQADLTDDQLEIINLPTNRNFVIQGGPGTGKTVMAIYRAGQMPRNARVLVLVYNRPLCDFIRTGIADLNLGEVEVNTLDSWVSNFYHSLHLPVPKKDGQKDWDAIGARLSQITRRFYEHIIVDESQDCPEPLLRGIAKIADNITCFIDNHQKVDTKARSNVSQALSELCIPAPVTLTRNFRNTKQIRDASVLFWSGTPGETPPAEAEFEGERPKMIKCRTTRNGSFDFADQTKRMISIIMNNLDKEIGILVDTGGTLVHTRNDLRKELGDALHVQAHIAQGKNRERIDFSLSGVKILSHGTMKGLEFDILLLPNLDYANNNILGAAFNHTFDGFENPVTAVQELARNRLYVGMSRPLQKLFIFYFKNFEQMMPSQKTIVKPIFDHPQLFDWVDEGSRSDSQRKLNLFD